MRHDAEDVVELIERVVVDLPHEPLVAEGNEELHDVNLRGGIIDRGARSLVPLGALGAVISQGEEVCVEGLVCDEEVVAIPGILRDHPLLGGLLPLLAADRVDVDRRRDTPDGLVEHAVNDDRLDGFGDRLRGMHAADRPGGEAGEDDKDKAKGTDKVFHRFNTGFTQLAASNLLPSLPSVTTSRSRLTPATFTSTSRGASSPDMSGLDQSFLPSP